MSKYVNADEVIEVIKSYGKGAIEDGLETLDPVEDIVLLAKAIDWIPGIEVVE